MKLNYDCIRDVLRYVEEQPLDANIVLDDLIYSLSEYTRDDLYYSCIKLDEAGFLSIETIKTLGFDRPYINRIFDVTFSGHEFLANIKEDSAWNEVKNTATKVGASSLAMIGKIATEIAIHKITSYLSSL